MIILVYINQDLNNGHENNKYGCKVVLCTVVADKPADILEVVNLFSFRKKLKSVRWDDSFIQHMIL